MNIHKTMGLTAQVEQAMLRLQVVKKSAIPVAAARAINAVGVFSERQTTRQVAKEKRVKQSAIKARIKPLQKANSKAPQRRVRVRLSDMPVVSMGKPRQTKKGVTVRGRRIDHAFMADGSKGKGKYISRSQRRAGGNTHRPTRLDRLQVFKRTGRGRYPLEVVKEPIRAPLLAGYERNVRRGYNLKMAPEMTKALASEMAKFNKKA
ncbi:hypothetical protein A1OW_21630 [Enterovibrio norvegicus]|uniref:phage tail protein n=1 Tax=Enterovibrio norvegicus TaxID=188144 RepID=UPI0002DFE0F4|nr:phage tail protein [Enterovibrio norvegicus]OEF59283.1 hypothetical protein A1OW_21630 [Enterovibrio norvegicus]